MVATRLRRHRRAARWDVTILHSSRMQRRSSDQGPNKRPASHWMEFRPVALAPDCRQCRVGSRRAERLQMLYSDGHESTAA